MFELLCNILLFVFLGFTYFTHVLEAKVPKSYMKNPNVLHPSVWPKAIIILLLVCIAINIYKIIKKNKGNPEFTFAAFGKNSLAFLKSKMFLGMVILIVASLILEPLGFVVTAALIMFSYGMLLGEKKWSGYHCCRAGHSSPYCIQRTAGRQPAPRNGGLPSFLLPVP